MKKILKFIALGLLVSSIWSCEKDNITSPYFDNNLDRMDVVAQDLRKTLASSPTGWVMMVKTNLNSEVYTPVILKFDTVKNVVDVRTVYGETVDAPAYFRIANGTGSPQLTFTTGSIMSSLYRVGALASDISDHIYNVVSVSADTIAIRGYRSGVVYKPEGGVIYKLFKRPADWKWADNERYFDFTNPAFQTDVMGVSSEIRFEYANNPTKNKTINTLFNAVAAANLQTMRNGFAFALSRNIGAGGFQPTNHVTFRFPYLTSIYDGAPIVATNSLSFLPGLSGYTSNVTWLRNFVDTYNFHYLVCKQVVRTGNNVKMEFEAYDQKGKAIVKAFYNNLK